MAPVSDRRSAVARAAKVVLAVATLQLGVVLAHFGYSAHIYYDSGRLHVVAPALASLALAVLTTVLFVWRPRASTLALMVLVVGGPGVLMFGLFHGAWSHLAKLILFHAGAPAETLVWLFDSPDFVLPNDVPFEASGLLTLVLGVPLGVLLVRLVRTYRGTGRGTGSTDAPSSGRSEVPAGALAPTAMLGLGAGERGSGNPLRLVGLAFQMLLDSPFKSLGTLVGVIVSVFLMAQQASLLVGILTRVTSFVEGTGVDIWISSLATESADATETIPTSRVAAAAGTRGVLWAEPIVQGIGKITRPDGVREFVKVLGVRPPRYAGLPLDLAEGTERSDLRASRRIFVNWNDRPSFGSAEPGDRIEIDGQSSIIAGFFKGMDPHSPYYYVFSNIDDARRFTSFPGDRTTFIAVGLEPGADAVDVKSSLESRIPDVLVRTRREMSEMEERYFLVRTPVGLVFGMGSVFAALIGTAIVAVTLYATTVDRSRDYGTLKAIGARQRDILQLLLAQAWLFFAVGYAIGLTGFFIARKLLPELPMVAEPKIILGVAGAALLSCTIASVAAVWRVLSLDPAIVFRA